MNSDHLGLLAAIISAFGLIVAALIRRDGEAKREAERQVHETKIAQILAADRHEKDNDNGSGYAWVICTLIISGLIILFF